MKRSGRYAVLVGASMAAVIGGFVGGTAIGAIGQPTGYVGVESNTGVGGEARAAVKVEYPTNASGQTYGSGENAASPADEPDLTAAWATNGKYGYVLKTDLYAVAEPTSPEEALTWQQDNGDKTRSFPVYEADGKTVIGTFVTSVPIDNGAVPLDSPPKGNG